MNTVNVPNWCVWKWERERAIQRFLAQWRIVLKTETFRLHFIGMMLLEPFSASYLKYEKQNHRQHLLQKHVSFSLSLSLFPMVGGGPYYLRALIKRAWKISKITKSICNSRISLIEYQNWVRYTAEDHYIGFKTAPKHFAYTKTHHACAFI